MQVEVDHQAGEAVGALSGAFVFRAPSRRRVALLHGLPEPLRQQASGFMTAEVICHAAPASSAFVASLKWPKRSVNACRACNAVQCGVNLPFTGGLDMRILAASFMTRPSAVRALEALDGRFGTGHTRIAVLGGTGEQVGGPKPEMILAGRFTDDVIAAVRGAILELGGTVVVDVDEDRTR